VQQADRIMNSFLVGVLPHKAIPGISRIEDVNQVKTMITGTLREVLESDYPQDAHFCCYHVAGEASWPRINKSALLPLEAAGHPPLCHFFAVDFDNAGHAPMTEELFYAWMEQVANLQGAAAQWSCHYTTKHGARLVYMFDQPTRALQTEDYIRGLHMELQRQGLDPDTKASEWNRLFRAPRVVRDGAASSDDPWFMIEWQEEVLSLSQLSPVSENSLEAAAIKAGNVATAPKTYAGNSPDYHTAKCLIECFSNNRTVQTEWYKWAKKRLRGRTCFDIIFNHTIMALPGDRDTTMLQYVGEAVSMLYGHQDTTPEHIFAIFQDAAAELDPDQDWMEILWSMITRMWEVESQKVELQAVKTEETQLEAGDKLAAMASGMKEWTGVDLSAYPEGQRDDLIKRHAIACFGSYYCLMTGEGTYEKMFLQANSLIPRILTSGMADVIDPYIYTKDGDRRQKSPTQIINDHATLVGEIRRVPQIRGGYIKDANTDHAVLVLPAYRRSENVQPVFNQEVDTWLQLLGGEHYSALCKWISYSLSFEDGPMCAMSIVGPPGVGKKMLVEGLVECLQEPFLASARDIVGQYQSGLLKSPFLLVNESWPAKKDREISGVFRELTGGDTITVDEKHKPLMQINNPVRILLTANNDEMVQELAGNKDLSPEDRRAIADRLYHFENTNEAGDYLQSLGGREYTAKKGNRWVRGDGTGVSDYIVAQHFMYLYHNRHRYQKDNRFVMQGNVAGHTDLMHRMLTSGHTTPVVECLIAMIENPSNVDRGVFIGSNGVWVLTTAIDNLYHCRFADKTNFKLNIKTIDKVLCNLVTCKTVPMIMPGHEDEGKHLWHQIDLHLLLKEAERYGHQCKKLRKLIEQHQNYGK